MLMASHKQYVASTNKLLHTPPYTASLYTVELLFLDTHNNKVKYCVAAMSTTGYQQHEVMLFTPAMWSDNYDSHKF